MPGTRALGFEVLDGRQLETFDTLKIEFVRLSESLDTATPAGRMVLTVLGAVAEWSVRSLSSTCAPAFAMRERKARGSGDLA